jgi:MFS family permease
VVSLGEFDWDSQEQGVILGSNFYGNIATQVIGGLLAEKFGGKWVFGSGALISALASLLTPLAARRGIGWIVAARVLFGMGQVT